MYFLSERRRRPIFEAITLTSDPTPNKIGVNPSAMET